MIDDDPDVIRPDEELSDADWTKRMWDLPTDPDEFLRAFPDMFKFMPLPVARVMPRSLFDALVFRGRLTPEGWPRHVPGDTSGNHGEAP